MATLLFLLVTCLVALFIIFLVLLWSMEEKRIRKGKPLYQLPPGRMGLPLIGQTIQFMQPHSSASFGEFLDQNIAIYGRIFRMNLLGKPTIVSLDPDLNRLILQSEGRMFLNSCSTSIAQIMGRWSLLAVTGDIHRDMRSVAVNFMNNVKLRTYFLPDVDRQVIKILDSWKDKTTVISGQDEAKKFAFSLMVKHLMSMDEGMPATEQIRKEYRNFMQGMASIPFNLPGTAYRKALKSRAIILGIMSGALDERVKRMEEKRQALVEQDDLLATVSKHPTLTREQILDLMLGMLFAGHETSSAAISLAIYFLESCPEAVRQLREEHTRIAKLKEEKEDSAGLNWEDYKLMEFTHCVINEILRLGNIVKFLHRKAIKDVQYKGYIIPCGWEVVPILPAAHLDPNIYDDPQSFNPWRWQDINNAAVTSRNNSIMSFSGGPRLCPGAELARMEIAVFLHHLVLRYEWELAERDHPVSFPFLVFPKGLPIKVRAPSTNQ